MIERNWILLVFPVKENQRVSAEEVREFFLVLFADDFYFWKWKSVLIFKSIVFYLVVWLWSHKSLSATNFKTFFPFSYHLFVLLEFYAFASSLFECTANYSWYGRITSMLSLELAMCLKLVLEMDSLINTFKNS